jgi:Sap-like sulfolipid-1-addressing protein
VLAQAVGLAFLAALSPTALLVTAVYLGSARPRLTALCYLAGALPMTLVIGSVVLVALRSGHLERPEQHAPRDGLRLGLGLLMLARGAVVSPASTHGCVRTATCCWPEGCLRLAPSSPSTARPASSAAPDPGGPLSLLAGGLTLCG